MFAENRPDRLLGLELPETRQAVVEPGGVGLSTWLTRAEFRNVKVTRGNETLLGPNAPLGGPASSGWKVQRGDWEQREGMLRQTNPGEDMRATAGDPRWTEYTYSLQVRKLSGDEGFLVMFRVRDERNFYWWNLGGWLNTKHAIEKSSGGAQTIVGNEVPARIETGKWYDVRIEVQGPRIRRYLDGKLIHDVEDRGTPELAAVAGRRGDEIIVKVVNASNTAKALQLDLKGAGPLAPKAEAWGLSGGPEEENSLDRPERIRPRPVVLPRGEASFPHTFPPHSVTVMRLREQKRK